MGTDESLFEMWVQELMTESDPWWLTPSEGWVPREQRFDQTFKDFWWAISWDRFYRPSFDELLDGASSQYIANTYELEDFYGYADGFEWWNNPSTVAELVIMGVDDQFEGVGNAHHLDYEQCYQLFEFMGFPWILDTHFEAVFSISENGASTNAISGMMRDWMFSSDAWETSPPEGWMTMEDRIIPTYPYEPTEEMLKLYLREEIQDAIDRLWELDTQVVEDPLHELDWEQDDEEQLDDLSDLLFEVQEYVEGTYVVM